MVITHKFWVITWFRISDSELELTRRQNSAHSHTSEISGIDQNDQFFKNWNKFSNLFQILANSIGLSSNYLSVIGSQILFQFSAWWKSFFGNRFYLIFLGFYLKYLANFFNLGWHSLAPIADGHSLFLISSLTHGTSMMEVHKFDWSIWIQKIHHPLIHVWTDFVRESVQQTSGDLNVTTAKKDYFSWKSEMHEMRTCLNMASDVQSSCDLNLKRMII